MPESPASRAVAAKNRQQQVAKRATIEALRAKNPPKDEFEAPFGEDGETVSFLYYAIGAQDYDALVTKCPPKPEQLAQGASYDINKFAPELLHRVCHEPKMTVAEWGEIWKMPTWSMGEVNDLLGRAVNLCLRGADIRPIGAG